MPFSAGTCLFPGGDIRAIMIPPTMSHAAPGLLSFQVSVAPLPWPTAMAPVGAVSDASIRLCNRSRPGDGTRTHSRWLLWRCDRPCHDPLDSPWLQTWPPDATIYTTPWSMLYFRRASDPGQHILHNLHNDKKRSHAAKNVLR